jgi:hypothetical protein
LTGKEDNLPNYQNPFSNRYITNNEAVGFQEILIPEIKKSKAKHKVEMGIQIKQIIKEEQTAHVPFLKYYINLEKSQGKVRHYEALTEDKIREHGNELQNVRRVV